MDQTKMIVGIVAMLFLLIVLPKALSWLVLGFAVGFFWTPLKDFALKLLR